MSTSKKLLKSSGALQRFALLRTTGVLENSTEFTLIRSLKVATGTALATSDASGGGQSVSAAVMIQANGGFNTTHA
ncbi:hypothetical protein ABNM01_23555, partial [Pseudomonas syringae]